MKNRWACRHLAHLGLAAMTAVVAVVTLVALSFSAAGPKKPPRESFSDRFSSAPKAAAPAKLLVLVVFDQMRGDYLERWDDLYGNDGFKRLTRDGAWFSNCHYPYAVTKTAAGHASLATGCSPARHGVIGNEWFDRRSGKLFYSVSSDRHEQVPPREKGVLKKDEEDGSVSPELVLVPTLADTLKKATGGKARVVALSFKDRSAVLLGGLRPDACYWFDTTTGSFVTSSYYRDRLHPWVEKFNAERPADAWFGKDWTPLDPTIDYVKRTRPTELTAAPDPDGPFRRPLPSFTRKPGSLYYKSLYATPFGNELLFQMMRRAVEAEALGTHDVPDLLCISFSANDAIGHLWGPDSPEVLDVTLRSDLLMKQLLEYLDAKVGKGRYVLALSADHGICPMPETTAARGVPAARLPMSLLGADANDFLRKTFGKEGDDAKTRWVLGNAEPWVYLNRTLIADRGLAPSDVEAALAKWYEGQTGILTAYTRTQLEKGLPADDVIGQRVSRSYRSDRAGDVMVVLKPLYLFSPLLSVLTNHGTPHPYDTHVPLLAYGPGIRKGHFKEPVTPQAIVPILARAAGIAPPATAEAPLPESLK